jgi:thymidylate synthase (FAD)
VKVSLISFTPEPLKVLYIAAKTCYSSDFPENNNPDEGSMKKLILNVYERGHESVFEHISFTFGVQDVSRVLTHQLVRHRIASYSQQSQRYVKMDKKIVIPPSIERNEEAREIYLRCVNSIWDSYEKLIKIGIDKEDARFILPNATTSNIVFTMNFRELIHTSGLRLCFRAQWEIKMLFTLVKKEIKNISPFLSDFLKPRCIRLGYCPEKESCGLRKRRKNGKSKMD